MKLFGLLFILSLFLFTGQKALAHSVQVGYCWNCDGDLRIWVEHWHGTEDPTSTTMTLDIIVGGVTTSRTGVPDTWVYGTNSNNLPGCVNPVTIFGACPDANTYNDWIAYDFNGLPTNVPIEVVIISGNNVFTQDDCGMYPASTGTIIIPDPPSYDDIISCSGPGVTIPEIPAGNDNVWTNDNPSIGLPASGTGSIPSFTPTISTTQQVANIHMSSTCGNTDFQIIIKPSPSVDFTGTSVAICFDDQPVTLTDNSSAPPGESITDWDWDYGDGSTGTGSSVSYTYSSPGIYTVGLEITASNGCQNRTTHDIRISPMPIAAFTVNPVCDGIPIAISDQSSVNGADGDNITDWDWTLDDGQTATGQNPSPTPTFNGEGVTNISLTVTTNNGCTATVDHDAVIYPLPDVEFTATTECLNFATDFTDGSSISNDYTTNSNDNYSWDFGDGNSSTSQNPSHTYGAAGDYTVNLTVTSNHSCVSDKDVVVTVYELPVADFTFVNACDNEEITFTSTATSTDASDVIDNYYWDVDGDIVSDYTGSTGSHVFAPYPAEGVHTITHFVEDANGCRDTIQQNVTVYALPDADFTFNNVCEDATTSFNNTSTVNNIDNDVITDYSWSFGNGQSSTDENPTLDFNTENVYNVKLVVETNYGCLDSITQQVEVYPLPDVNFTATTECLHFETSFTDQSSVSNNHTTNSNATYAWDFGDGSTSNQQNPGYTYGNYGNYNVTLEVTTNNGCVRDVTIPITVWELPVADFTFVNACDNEAITFASTATSTDANDNINDYFWDIDSDNNVDYTGATAGHVFVPYPAEGRHNVTHVVEDANGCRDTIQHEVIVYALPDANFTFNNVCEDATTSFNNTSTVNNIDNDVIIDYSWDFGNGQSSTDENPTLNFNTENVYNVKLVVETNYGCLDSITQQIEVYPLPDVNFTATTECLHFETSFTDQSSVSNNHTTNSNATYAWDFGDGSTSNQQNPGYTYGNYGNYNVTLEVTTNNGCVRDVTIPITVWELPVADFTFVNACDNEEVTMHSTATSTDANDDFTAYQWDFNQDDIVDSNGEDTQFVFNSDGYHTVTHYVTDANGCKDTIQQDVIVYALPIADFDATFVCEDETTDFTDQSSVVDIDGDIVVDYAWDFDDGNISTNRNPSNAFGSQKIYNVKLVVESNYGCLDSIVKPVEVYPLPVVDFSPTSVCLDFLTQFTDESTVSNHYTPNANVQWDWDFGDGANSYVHHPQHAYNQDGTFNATLIVTTNNGCVAQITKEVTVHPLPEVSFTGSNLEGCSPVCATMTSTSTINAPSTLQNYEWFLSDGTIYSGSSVTDCLENLTGNDISLGVKLVVTSNEGCINEHTEDNFINIYHHPVADFSFTPDDPDVIKTKVKFNNHSLYADSYVWYIGNYAPTNAVNPVVDFPDRPEKYEVTLYAYTDHGCVDSIKGLVDIKDRIVFYVPNTFTPDQDDYNEVFTPVFTNGFDPQNYHLTIFNRWGEILFESYDTNEGWDGTYGVNSDEIVKDGTYVWKIEFKESMSDKRHTHTGHVNLLR